MIRVAIALVLLALNYLALLRWTPSETTAATAFPALLAGLIAGAIVQRLIFGQQTGWQPRLHPAVVVATLLVFDLVLLGSFAIRHGRS